jgi:polar amino acid transport system substrate-binding protein
MACAGTIAALVTGLTLAAAEPVIIATDAPFPNYTFIDDQGAITGFERDLLDDVCRRAALTCSWVDTTFERLIPGVMSGEFDIAVGGIAITDERRLLVDFTASYHASDGVDWYVGLPGAPAPSKAVISVQAGTVHESFLRDQGYRYLAFPTEAEVFAALSAGLAQLALGPFQSREDLLPLLDANGFDYLYSDTIPDDGVGMAVCKGNTDLMQALNAALDAMRRDGTLDSIELRWF